MMTMRKVLLAACVLLSAGLVEAKPAKPLFDSDAPLQLTLSGPIGSLAGSADGKFVDGTLAVAGAAPETLGVRLSARGITRRARDICQFPPIRVEFPEKPGAGSLFKGQKKLKLVTHCRVATGFQQYLLLELAAYRMFNVLTPASFRVRLATIDYRDGQGKPIATRMGFFIEDADDVAARNDMAEIETKERLRISQLAAREAARFAMFEYMIGNLDWAMTAGPAGTNCCHNSRLIGLPGATSGIVPVPYDFDFAGMVDAPYATPPAAIPLPNVRVRRFRGFCRHSAEMPGAAAELVAKRAQLVGVFDGLPQLDEKTKRKATAYLDGFFAQAATPDGVAKLVAACIN